MNQEDDSNEPNVYYTGGEKSEMLVQGPKRVNYVEALSNHARQAGAEEGNHGHYHQMSSSSSRSFAGRGRLLSGETTRPAAPIQPESEVNNNTHTITFWTNGFTINDGPLRRQDDPQNA
ncbi:plant UBX domain-containing protein 4-like [Rutidosis leptorrhynchoides]|uniref:plant UBX domain-containing protein 4-like n=1 Tax=Rutidosis leptorrhynchoides TaxID=125765 RepID=UPI003A999A6E